MTRINKGQPQWTLGKSQHFPLTTKTNKEILCQIYNLFDK